MTVILHMIIMTFYVYRLEVVHLTRSLIDVHHVAYRPISKYCALLLFLDYFSI